MLTVRYLYGRATTILASVDTSTLPTIPENSLHSNEGSVILAKFISTSNPIRNWICDFKDRPSVGYRYDGLYRATGIEGKVLVVKKKADGVGEDREEEYKEDGDEDKQVGRRGERKGNEVGCFWTVFKLERCLGQKDIDNSRPTEQEKRAFTLIGNGF